MEWGQLPPRKRRSLRLQLAPLIDIFVVIIIFLVKGTFIGQISVSLPENLKPAVSKSTESMELAPEVFAFKDSVYLKMIDKKVSLAAFTQNDRSVLDPLMSDLKQYTGRLSESEKKSEILNFVADATLNYKSVFDVTKMLREAGFQSILFIAQGER
jgi:biopolymer transport protein ExbD